MHLPHFDYLSLIVTAATILGGWVTTRIVAPKAHERAELLAKIAAAAAALVVSLNPTADWSLLLSKVVKAIADAAGLPTTNAQAIERAAAEALTRLGKNPGVK